MDFQEIEQIFGISIDELLSLVAGQLGEGATQKEAEEALAALFEQLTSNTGKTYSLHQCLSFLLKDDLVEIMKANGFRGYSKMRKDDLVNYLEEALLKPEYMEGIYPSLTEMEVDILDGLCVMNTPLVSTDIMFTATDLIRHGVCYLDEFGRYLVLPKELKEAFYQAQEQTALSDQQERNSAIYCVCAACVYLYGVYPIAALQERIAQVAGITLTEQELLQWHADCRIQREEFFFKNGHIISTALRETPEDVVALQQIQKQKKRFFWPDSELLDTLSMEQWLIQESLYHPLWELSPRMMENEFGDIMSVSRFIEASIRTGAPFDSLMGFLSEQIFAFDTVEEIDVFVQIMQTIWDNTPMWENCGHTPKQMNAAMQKPTAKPKAAQEKVVSLAEHKAKKNK